MLLRAVFLTAILRYAVLDILITSELGLLFVFLNNAAAGGRDQRRIACHDLGLD